VELVWNTWGAKAGCDVTVVAERLVVRFAAAAESGAGQDLDSPIFATDLHFAGHQQWPVAHRRNAGWRIGFLLPAAVQPPIEERAAWAPANDFGNFICITHVGQEPGTPLEIEDPWVAAQTFGDMDAEVQVEADLYVAPAIDLSHVSTIRSGGDVAAADSPGG
jgi:hypothetical protein